MAEDSKELGRGIRPPKIYRQRVIRHHAKLGVAGPSFFTLLENGFLFYRF